MKLASRAGSCELMNQSVVSGGQARWGWCNIPLTPGFYQFTRLHNSTSMKKYVTHCRNSAWMKIPKSRIGPLHSRIHWECTRLSKTTAGELSNSCQNLTAGVLTAQSNQLNTSGFLRVARMKCWYPGTKSCIALITNSLIISLTFEPFP